MRREETARKKIEGCQNMMLICISLCVDAVSCSVSYVQPEVTPLQRLCHNYDLVTTNMAFNMATGKHTAKYNTETQRILNPGRMTQGLLGVTSDNQHMR